MSRACSREIRLSLSTKSQSSERPMVNSAPLRKTRSCCPEILMSKYGVRCSNVAVLGMVMKERAGEPNYFSRRISAFKNYSNGRPCYQLQELLERTKLL